jgi:hypothetical protein
MGGASSKRNSEADSPGCVLSESWETAEEFIHVAQPTEARQKLNCLCLGAIAEGWMKKLGLSRKIAFIGNCFVAQQSCATKQFLTPKVYC